MALSPDWQSSSSCLASCPPLPTDRPRTRGSVQLWRRAERDRLTPTFERSPGPTRISPSQTFFGGGRRGRGGRRPRVFMCQTLSSPLISWAWWRDSLGCDWLMDAQATQILTLGTPRKAEAWKKKNYHSSPIDASKYYFGPPSQYYPATWNLVAMYTVSWVDPQKKVCHFGKAGNLGKFEILTQIRKRSPNHGATRNLDGMCIMSRPLKNISRSHDWKNIILVWKGSCAGIIVPWNF